MPWELVAFAVVSLVAFRFLMIPSLRRISHWFGEQSTPVFAAKIIIVVALGTVLGDVMKSAARLTLSLCLSFFESREGIPTPGKLFMHAFSAMGDKGGQVLDWIFS